MKLKCILLTFFVTLNAYADRQDCEEMSAKCETQECYEDAAQCYVDGGYEIVTKAEKPVPESWVDEDAPVKKHKESDPYKFIIKVKKVCYSVDTAEGLVDGLPSVNYQDISDNSSNLTEIIKEEEDKYKKQDEANNCKVIQGFGQWEQ